MKFMGSKRYLLQNGLGAAILELSRSADRVVDLFAGSGAVAWFAAERTNRPTVASDLQEFAAAMCRAVVSRTSALDGQRVAQDWLGTVHKEFEPANAWREVRESRAEDVTVGFVRAARLLCSREAGTGPIWRSYGGHYFSPRQAAILDTMVRALPAEQDPRNVCLAATIMTASKCAAAPGHTAQPFQPTASGIESIRESWRRDPLKIAEAFVRTVAARKACVLGKAFVGDAIAVASSLSPGDLAIIDPPYSAVQYSRFYHVLETVALGRAGEVEGVGRYPARSERPQSVFSLKSRATKEAERLLRALAAVGCRAIVTFPAGEASNGLSGDVWVSLASRWFELDAKVVNGKFSTLGGRPEDNGRAARHVSAELILTLTPRRTGW